MTQNTQTTAERVRDMAVSQIAAEIDALTAERDGVRDIYAAQGAILAAARMEIESLKANVSGWQVKAGDAGNKLVRSEQEAQRLTRMRDFERDAAGTMADQYSILAEERNALKAEVERLRVPALALELLKGEGWTVADYVAKAEVAAAARAAKEGTEQ